MKLINLTPHAVTILPQVGDDVQGDNHILAQIQPSGLTVRCVETTNYLRHITLDNGVSIPIYQKVMGNVCLIDRQGNQSPIDTIDLSGDCLYIVSKIAYDAIPNNLKHYFVMVNDTVRDQNGNIWACRSLSV